MNNVNKFGWLDAGVNIGCPSIMTLSKTDKTKTLIFYSHSYFELFYFYILSAGFVCQTILLHHFMGII